MQTLTLKIDTGNPLFVRAAAATGLSGKALAEKLLQAGAAAVIAPKAKPVKRNPSPATKGRPLDADACARQSAKVYAGAKAKGVKLGVPKWAAQKGITEQEFWT